MAIEGLNEVTRPDTARSTKMDCTHSVEEYVNREDWRISANSNTSYSQAGLVNNLAGKAIANYFLDKLYTKAEGDSHRKAEYHIHDLDVLGPYCCGHDLQKLLNQGFNGVSGRVGSKAPKHFREALYQMANYVGILQAEWAGAQAFSSFDTYLAPIAFFDIYHGGLEYDDLKKAVRNFVYNLNVPSRWGQCVPATYPALRADGRWVNYRRLKEGDEIVVVDKETGSLTTSPLKKVNVFEAPTKMHRYTADDGTSFDVTSEHKVLHKTEEGWKLTPSSELLAAGEDVDVPLGIWGDFDKTPELPISDDMLKLFTVVAAQGWAQIPVEYRRLPKESLDSRGLRRLVVYQLKDSFGCDLVNDLLRSLTEKYRVCDCKLADGRTYNRFDITDPVLIDAYLDNLCPSVEGNFFEHIGPTRLGEFAAKLSVRQALVVLDTWTNVKGHFDTNTWELATYCDPSDSWLDCGIVREALAYLGLRAGKGATMVRREIPLDDNGTTQHYQAAGLTKKLTKTFSVKEVKASCEEVWCPTTDAGTFVTYNPDNGVVFFTGNSPFSNVTIDLRCPDDIANNPPTREDKPFFVSVYEEHKPTLDKVSDWKRRGEPEEDKPTRKELACYDGWEELLIEARRRLNDFESDAETVLYSLCYKHFDKEIKLVFRAYYEVMDEGDAFGLPFTFPIPTVNITENFDWDNPEYDVLWNQTAKYGSSYFQNFVGSQYLRDENGELTIRDQDAYSPKDLRSMCCRLSLSRKALRKRGGGLFGSDSETGSIGVVTINLARLGYEYRGNESGLISKLYKLMDRAKSTLEKKRSFVKEMVLRGLYPYTRRYINSAKDGFSTFFSTIGVNGMNECIRNFTNDEHNIADEWGQAWALKIMGLINVRLLKYQEESNNLYNLEASPGEGTTYRFAKEDLKTFGRADKVYVRCPEHGLQEVSVADGATTTCPVCGKSLVASRGIIQAGVPEAPYYTNSTQLPVDFGEDVFSALDLQDDLQKTYTGGSVFHIYSDENVTGEQVKNLIRKVVSNYRLPYISYTATFSTCPKHGRIPGLHDFCPMCDQEILAAHYTEFDPNQA